LQREYVGERTIVWFAFGERELRPYPSPPPDWLVAVQQRRSNAWHVVLTEVGRELRLTKAESKKAGKKLKTRKAATKRTAKSTTAAKRTAANLRGPRRKS
jgi:hypothetical protein